MKIVWRLGRPTVREVYEQLLEQRKTAYTSVMTMLNVLVDKGRLKRRKHGRAFVYQPTESKQQVLGSMVQEFLGRVFDGSAKPLLVQLVEDRDLSEEDLADIQRMIREKEGGAQ